MQNIRTEILENGKALLRLVMTNKVHDVVDTTVDVETVFNIWEVIADEETHIKTNIQRAIKQQSKVIRIK